MESPVPGIIAKYLTDDGAHFVAASQDLAFKLRESQSGRNPDGMLLIAHCHLSSESALLIIKLEHQIGMQASFIEMDGKKTFDVQQVRDLMFTTKSRVYKIGLFHKKDITDAGIAGYVVDKQSPGSALASFFLSSYLGCRLRDDPAEVTQSIYGSTIEWINTSVDSGNERHNYTQALQAELRSNTPVISAKAFAGKHLPAERRDSYLQHLEEAGLPTTLVDKDCSLIETKLSATQYIFSTGASIIVPQEAIEQGLLTVEAIDELKTRVAVTDHIEQIKGIKGRKGKAGSSSNSEGED